MKEKVVIIGSGLGGLQCGYILARHGFDVTVLERAHQIGGCLQTFMRRGVRFDTGFHYVGGLDEGQPLNRLFHYFDLLGLPWHRLDADCFDEVVIGEESFPFASGHDRFAERMIERFPAEREGILKYTAFLKNVGDHIFDSFSPREAEDFYGNSLFALSAYDFLNETVGDPLLRKVLSGTSLKMELNAESLPLYVYAQINNSFIQSAWRLRGGGSLITNHLAESIRSMGGRVLADSEVISINVENGRVCRVGVRMAEKTRSSAEKNNSVQNELSGLKSGNEDFSELSELRSGIGEVSELSGLKSGNEDYSELSELRSGIGEGAELSGLKSGNEDFSELSELRSGIGEVSELSGLKSGNEGCSEHPDIEYEADWVISDAHPALAVSLVRPTDALRKIYKKRITNLKNTFGMFTANIALKEKALPYLNKNIFVHTASADLWRPNLSATESVLVSYSATEGEWARGVDLLSPMSWEDVARWAEMSPGRRGAEYDEFKLRKLQDCTKLVGGRLPEIAKAVDESHIYISTPLSYNSYLGQPQGSAYGIRKDWRNTMSTVLTPATQIPNLLLTGQNLNLHGILGVSMASIFTCAAILGLDSLSKEILSGG